MIQQRVFISFSRHHHDHYYYVPSANGTGATGTGTTGTGATGTGAYGSASYLLMNLIEFKLMYPLVAKVGCHARVQFEVFRSVCHVVQCWSRQ